MCAVIPYLKKGFSSRADVFPGVPESAVAAANQLSALESLSHLTVSQHFHLNHLLLPQQNTATVYTALTLDTRVGYRTTMSPSLPWLPGNELCYLASLYKWMNTAASFCFLKLPLTIVTSFSDNTPVFICSMHIWNAAEAYLQLVLSWVWNIKEMQYNKGILERSEGTGPLMAA